MGAQCVFISTLIMFVWTREPRARDSASTGDEGHNSEEPADKLDKMIAVSRCPRIEPLWTFVVPTPAGTLLVV